MDCTMYAVTIRKTQEPARPAPQPRKTHRAPVKVAELRAYAADLEYWIEELGEYGLSAAPDVAGLVKIRSRVYAEIAALRRGGVR